MYDCLLVRKSIQMIQTLALMLEFRSQFHLYTWLNDNPVLKEILLIIFFDQLCFLRKKFSRTIYWLLFFITLKVLFLLISFLLRKPILIICLYEGMLSSTVLSSSGCKCVFIILKILVTDSFMLSSVHPLSTII